MGYFHNAREPKDPVEAKVAVCELSARSFISPEIVKQTEINADGERLLSGRPPEAGQSGFTGFCREWRCYSPPQSFPLR